MKVISLLTTCIITEYADLSAVPFYEKNGFLHLTKKDEDEHTRLMYFDMMEIAADVSSQLDSIPKMYITQTRCYDFLEIRFFIFAYIAYTET